MDAATELPQLTLDLVTVSVGSPCLECRSRAIELPNRIILPTLLCVSTS